MTTNQHVNLHNAANEQSLVESLITESIQFYGFDMYYVVRTGEEDKVFQEQQQSEFNAAFPIEMYIKSVDGYGGDGQFLSNFGIEIRHQALFTVSQSRWVTEATAADVEENIVPRPREGDLIYFAKDNKLLEIKRVNQYELFYQLGALHSWDLTCEVFDYNSESFNTGVAAIDAIETTLSVSTRDKGSVVDGDPIFDDGFNVDDDGTDQFADNSDIDEAGAPLIDFTEDNPFSESF